MPRQVGTPTTRFDVLLHLASTSKYRDVRLAANMFNYLDKVFVPGDATNMAAMGVLFDNRGFKLIINADWMMNLRSKKVFEIVLYHEALHILLRDIQISQELLEDVTDEKEKQLRIAFGNIAADMAVNSCVCQHIPDADKVMFGGGSVQAEKDLGMVLPDQFHHPKIGTLPRGMDCEWYMKRLLEIFPDYDDLVDEIVSQMMSHIADMRGAVAAGEGRKDEKPEEGEEDGGHQKRKAKPRKRDDRLTPAQHEENERALRNALNHKNFWQAAMNKLSDEDKEALAKHLDQQGEALLRSAHKDEESGSGHRPGQHSALVKSLIEAALKETPTPWPELVRKLAEGSIAADIQYDQTLPMRSRYIFSRHVHDKSRSLTDRVHLRWPGTKTDETHCILVSIDVSGSMDQEAIVSCLNELNTLANSLPDAKLYVAQFDYGILHIHEMGENEDVEAYVENIGRCGGGGTSFDDSTLMAKWHETRREEDYPRLSGPDLDGVFRQMRKPDLVVIMTDGYAYTVDQENRCAAPVIWLLAGSPQAEMKHFEKTMEFGHVISDQLNPLST